MYQKIFCLSVALLALGACGEAEKKGTPKTVVNLKSTGRPQAVVTGQDKTIKVTTDNNTLASYQLESDRLPVKPGETIKVSYDITVESGGIMSLGLLNTTRNGWYGNELILEAGNHKGIYKMVVPKGETEASLVLRNYHLKTPGQTTFTVKEVSIEKN